MALIHKDGSCLRVQGAMTVDTLNALLAETPQAFAAENLEIDLGKVSEVDSASISLIFEWMRQAHGRNISLVFVNLPASLVSLATLYGVLDLIPQHSH